jgi:putative ABC transport system permease protein
MFRLTNLLTLRSIRVRFLRFALSGFGIVLGVAGMLAINVTNQAALNSIVELFQSTSGNAKLTILTSSSDSSQGYPEQALRTVKNIAGINLAAPLVKGQTLLSSEASPDQLALGLFGASISGGIQVYGIDPTVDQQIRSYKLTAGRFLSNEPSAREIVLVEDYAKDKDLELDQWIDILTSNGVEGVKIVGLMAKDGAGQTNNGNFGVIPLRTAQEFFNRNDRLDQIDILTAENISNSKGLDNLKNILQARLGNEYSVIYPANQGKGMTQMLQNYQIGLNFLSGVALFVGAFLIYNAFAMTVTERTREFGMLRTIGMTPGDRSNASGSNDTGIFWIHSWDRPWSVAFKGIITTDGSDLESAFAGSQVSRGNDHIQFLHRFDRYIPGGWHSRLASRTHLSHGSITHPR